MPTYSYACTACDHRFDAQQSFTDAALTECPECQGRLRKLFNSVGIVFKGSGFYRTDSRGADPAKASESAGAGSGSKESKESKETAATGSGGKSSGSTDSAGGGTGRDTGGSGSGDGSRKSTAGGSGKKSSNGSKAMSGSAA